MPRKDRSGPIYTIGHSNRTFDELVAMLRAFGVTALADIRTVPRSRHNPQFNRDTLRAALRRRSIRYVHVPELGGLRRARKDSPNGAWRNASFRGYADHMQTESFHAGVGQLLALSETHTVAIMCAEAVPWRCHRSLVADALTARGVRVEHIASRASARPHRITPFALVEDERVTYPAGGRAAQPLPTRAPFHHEATVRVLQRRPSNVVDLWEAGRYRRVLAVAGELALVEVENRGSVDAPDLYFTALAGGGSAQARDALAAVLRKVLGLDAEPDGLQRLAEREPRVAAAARALRGLRPPCFPELFETFASVVPYQQVSLAAGGAIVARLVQRFGAALEHEGRRYHAFPPAELVASARLDRLRACGLSARKAESLRSIARAVASGELRAEAIARQSTAEAVERLRDLPGIGPWSAQLVLLRGFGRVDVFPPGDVGADRGLRELLHVRPRASIERIAARCGEQRGYLYLCALGSKLVAEGLIEPAPQAVKRR